MIQLDLTTKPKFTRPELLLHPSIPLILSGVNPRTIYGKEWWDKVRRVVYAENNFCCFACGVFQLDAVYEQTLDAHETYDYDYKKYEARPGEVVALCRACHWFIHWRRVRQPQIRKEVVIRGLRFLAGAGQPVPYEQHKHALAYDWYWGEERYPNLQIGKKLKERKLFFRKWVLVMGKDRYNIGGKIDADKHDR